MHACLPLVLTLALLSGAGPAQTQSGPPAPLAQAPMINDKGKSIGTATFWQGANALVIRINLSGLPRGAKGLHLHKTGTCDAADGFKTAAGHIHGGAAASHGLLHPAGPEWGDLPNLIVPKSGKVEVELATTLVRLTGPGGILDDDGASLVIHANPDDHFSQPIGGAGPRIACGVIRLLP
jgi:superoxide dismutase, Cu-Zn family